MMAGGAPLGVNGLTDAVAVGRGGFAVVYRAFQPAFDRFVAVKVFDSLTLDDSTMATFEKECRAIGRVSGRPNILTVYEAGVTDAGDPFLVMPYMPGGSLEDRLRRDGRFPWQAAVEIGIKLARALQVAHDAAVLHRDVKPDNILLSDDDEPYLADFGIARLTDATRTSKSQLSFTPAHVAPEVLSGAPPTPAMDVYSLASSLFSLIVGHPAFLESPQDSFFVVMNRVQTAPVPDLLRPLGVPDIVCRAIEAAMAKSEVERPPSASAFAAALEAGVRAATIPPPAPLPPPPPPPAPPALLVPPPPAPPVPASPARAGPEAPMSAPMAPPPAVSPAPPEALVAPAAVAGEAAPQAFGLPPVRSPVPPARQKEPQPARQRVPWRRKAGVIAFVVVLVAAVGFIVTRNGGTSGVVATNTTTTPGATVTAPATSSSLPLRVPIPNTIQVQGFTFVPVASAGKVGATITVTNLDGTEHSLTEDYGSFDTGIFTSGSKTITLTKAGKFSFHCRVHNFMTGTITVS